MTKVRCPCGGTSTETDGSGSGHAAGHQVCVTARSTDQSEALAAQYEGVRAMPAHGAASDADAVIVATGYADATSALRSIGDLAGKVVIDITNPLTADFMGLTLGYSTSAAEEVARAIPEAVIVKAFNTVFAQMLGGGAAIGQGQTVSVFYASDSARAKSTTKALAEGMGSHAVDAGPLKNARYLEPLAGLNVYLGDGAGMGTGIAPAWLRLN